MQFGTYCVCVPTLSCMKKGPYNFELIFTATGRYQYVFFDLYGCRSVKTIEEGRAASESPH
jgi:hypothetical protein